MKRADLVGYCLAKPGTWLDEPWEGDQVVKVADKIFVFLGAVDAERPGIGIKCGRTAEDARELRDRFPAAVTVSAYIGRYGWNSVRLDGTVPDDEVFELVDASYESVVAALPKGKRPRRTTSEV
ncbi:MAG TPA: MmcQ/YjbR family DNA-binding protein [Mycobacteriales bacterium]|jgi:predicted DNA-binding protein (MmcQ/YjbR family)|nr:MmcQ/YjbR family DNA-binding protein [Mycobacteriales bacterium]